MPESAKQHVGSVDILVNGAKLDPTYRDLLSEVKVVDSLTLPDSALVRITDLKGGNGDGNPRTSGAKLETKFGETDATSTTSVLKAQTTSLALEFTSTGVTISARA